MITPSYIWHWFHLQVIDLCLWVHKLTGWVLFPVELLSLLLAAVVILVISAIVVQTLVELREDERTDLK